MKTWKTAAWIIFLPAITHAQNLVPNPSFEDTIACPENYYEEVALAQGWSSFAGSSDYAHACAGTVPNLHAAHDGDAFVGLFTYLPATNDYREHVGATLSDTLVIGQEYFVTLYAARSTGWTGATDNLGVRFSMVPPSVAAPLTNSAHVYSTSVITEDVNWTRISGSFIADSAYRYILIGNFFDSTNTVHNGNGAYYYVDDICVSTNSMTCPQGTMAVNELNTIAAVTTYPNPAGSGLTLTFSNPGNEQHSLALFDIHGKEVLLLPNISGDNIKIERADRESGIYFFQLRSTSGRSANGKIVFE